MFSSVDLQAACHGAQHWLWRCEWLSGQCEQMLCSWPWRHLSLSWRTMMSLSKWGFAVPSRHHIDLRTSKNLVGELGGCWHRGISRLGRHKKLVLKKDQITGIQRSRLGRDSSSLLLIVCWMYSCSGLCVTDRNMSPAQRAWATFLCSALTYLEGLYTYMLTNEYDCYLCPNCLVFTEKVSVSAHFHVIPLVSIYLCMYICLPVFSAGDSVTTS